MDRDGGVLNWCWGIDNNIIWGDLCVGRGQVDVRACVVGVGPKTAGRRRIVRRESKE